MDEFDKLGREAFLEKYGFGTANRYFLKRDDRLYDSKAIYGVAHRIQHPEHAPLLPADFSGGQQAIQGPLEALGFEFEVKSDGEKQVNDSVAVAAITSEDVSLIASSRSKKWFAELSLEEREAYARVSEALEALGKLLKSKLTNSSLFEVRTTSGFNVKSGIRSYVPKDLWFSVSPVENAKDLAGMPQLFMIVSERGIEYGFGASVSPNDFSQKIGKEIIRKAAPKIFDLMPKPDSDEAISLQEKIEASGTWQFQRKHRLEPSQKGFASFREWLRFLRSPEGKKNAAGTISKYLLPEGVDATHLETEIAEMAQFFEPLVDRVWHGSPELQGLPQTKSVEQVPREANLVGTNAFAQRLSKFLQCYGEKRSGSFGKDAELSAVMNNLQEWLEHCPAVASRPSIKVKISVGQGGWTKTPWIALLDERETTTTQSGTYVVFLIAEDLSVTYLTLNQGMTELRSSLGQNGAVEEMLRVAQITRPLVLELKKTGFEFDNNIDLHSTTGAARNYEIGTIVHFALPSNDLPDDMTISQKLESLLEAYDRIIEFKAEKVPPVQDDDVEPKPPAIDPYTLDDATAELFLERDDVARYLDIWSNKKNLILQGAPGVGKSFIARKLAYALIGYKDDSKVQTVQFHQSYSYEDFVQGYRPNGNQGFERKNGNFYEFHNRALRDPAGTYVFIIDEINRGNLSKIFGELLLLIEADKRGPTWKTRLAYAADGDPDFFVPDNLFILGMMNTADRSLSLVDYALRRRFAFVAMEPLYGSPKFRMHLEDQGVPEEIITRIINGMGGLNQAIESDRTNLGPGFRIGHSFFTPTTKVVNAEAWYRRIVETEIYPLLGEYWFDAPETADQWRDKLLS